MPSRIYNEYIKVDPNFIPVFSKSSDKVYPDKWQSFYPHDSFKLILKDVVDSLEKGSETKDRSIWMSGAYGTGKTYASFVIKHMLEDDLEKIKPYFDQNGMDTLYSRICGIRSKGKILVVSKSSSGDITTQSKLFNAIMEAVKDALANAGYSYSGGESLLSRVITCLEDSNSAFNFSGVFQKYRAKFTAYSNPQSVLRDLRELDLDAKLELLDVIIEVADLEGYNWSISTDDLIDWLDDVRKQNNLASIVFIWDEFTEYFKNNPNNVTGLQEIAHATSRISFYFFLITHSTAGQLIADQNARKIIEARFKLSRIELGESTAFKLLGQALRVNPDLQSEWITYRDALWDGVEKSAIKVIKGKDPTITDEDFKKLLPLHPYAAYLLKIIAKDISSNQRTIFQFLCGDEGNEARTNFRWFIDRFHYDYGNWNYLTADYLWDYFFLATENPDFDSIFTNAVSHYNNYISVCNDDDSAKSLNKQRVLKVTLLLAALQTKNGADAHIGATSLMRPTLINIKACFAGTPLESNVAVILDEFEKKGVFGKIENANEIFYVMTTTTYDNDRMEKILEETRKNITFEKLLEDSTYKISEQFLPNDFLDHRLFVSLITPNNAKAKVETAEKAPYRIPTFYLFAKNETEQAKIKDVISMIYEKIGDRCIVVDFSGLPFTDMLFEKLIQSKAKERYFQQIPNQKSQYDLARKTSEGIVREWKNKLISTALFIYSSVTECISKTGGANLRKTLKELNSKFYGCGLEEISINDKLFAESGFKETVAQMSMGKIDVPNNYAYLRNVSSKLQSDGIWSDAHYFETHPQHPVSRMKIALNEVIRRSFDEKRMVAITDLWRALQNPPFGLMPNTGSVFLLGFLLKEYSDGTYYKRDQNSNTVALNYIDLSELIYGAVKSLPKVSNQSIVKQTPEHAYFCSVTGQIFKFTKDKSNSIDDISKNINIYLTSVNYPLWALRYYIEAEMEDHLYYDALLQLNDLLCEFIKPETKIDREKSKIADDIYHVFKNNNGIADVYGEILTLDDMKTGMMCYIASEKPAIIQMINSLHITNSECLDLLNKKLSADSSYLWRKEETLRQIDNLYLDIKLINDINSLLTTKQKTYDAARKALIDKLNAVKIPNTLLIELHPDLKEIMGQLFAIRDNTIIDKRETSNVISNTAERFVSFFDNQYDSFRDVIYHIIGSSTTADEIDFLFNNVESGVLFKTIDDFTVRISQELKKYRQNKKYNQLREAWMTASKTNTPSEWSAKYNTPILVLFADNIIQAQRIFDGLNGTSYLRDADIDAAIAFIRSAKISIISDRSKCDECLLDFFAGEYSYILSPDEVREILRSSLGSNVYDWYAQKNKTSRAIKEYAETVYRSKFCKRAKQKIKDLSAADAQAYLERLIDDNPLLGIDILKK